MKVLLRLMLVIVMALAPATVVNAQSASAKYDEGMALYNKGKKAKAIKAFQASMVLDKSAENKARCNAMIQKCKARPRPSRDDYPKPKPVSNLSLGSERLEFDGKKVEADVVFVGPLPAEIQVAEVVRDIADEFAGAEGILLGAADRTHRLVGAHVVIAALAEAQTELEVVDPVHVLHEGLAGDAPGKGCGGETAPLVTLGEY